MDEYEVFINKTNQPQEDRYWTNLLIGEIELLWNHVSWEQAVGEQGLWRMGEGQLAKVSQQVSKCNWVGRISSNALLYSKVAKSTNVFFKAAAREDLVYFTMKK